MNSFTLTRWFNRITGLDKLEPKSKIPFTPYRYYSVKARRYFDTLKEALSAEKK